MKKQDNIWSLAIGFLGEEVRESHETKPEEADQPKSRPDDPATVEDMGRLFGGEVRDGEGTGWPKPEEMCSSCHLYNWDGEWCSHCGSMQVYRLPDGIMTVQELKEMAEDYREGRRIPIGRYAGKRVEEVPIDYLEWATEHMEKINDELRSRMRKVLQARRDTADWFCAV